ncbi:protein-disulfide reductase DsbD family protein [Acidipila rosea]|uniref:Thiol:disulfide interchange protein DsbD n=1 Tax=Acidipila rosea TaxID=768535 RepID=A0A4R1L7G5_9BACT|nr:protein-disulfide reductase DsbD domain-containing protein [Acidipila rosea]TCK74178.1 thiol:disulfide interchange protein DsbD [Acidipila rosea]
MRACRLPLFLAICLCCNLQLLAAPVRAQHLTVELIAPQPAIYPGATLEAGLYFQLDPGWHVYWVNAGDSGEPPKIDWSLPTGVTAEPMQFPAPQRLPLGPLMDFGYQHEVLFPITLHAADAFKPAGKSVSLPAKVDWLVCREVCIPGKANLTLDVQGFPAAPSSPAKDANAAAVFTRLLPHMPQPLPAGSEARFATSAKGFTLAVLTGSSVKSAQFFPFEQGVLSNPAPQTAVPLAKGVELTLTKDTSLSAAPKKLHGLLVLADGAAYEIDATPGVIPAGERSSDSGSLVRAIGLAFLGGIILNLMPCVFPVLFIKGLSLAQASREERSRMRSHGLVYAFGIVVSFWAVVAVLLGLRAGGSHLGWGFQFQSPGFVAIMALVLFFLGLSLAGQFEIGLSLTSAGGGLAAKQGYAGSFFTGVLAMVVATPCTAPFMGAAIGYALAQTAFVTFAVFTALALGLAAPYLLLAFNPVWTRLLPRPGAWMEILKQFTAIPVFGTAIWLTWLFAQTAGDNPLVLLLSGFLLLAVAGWVLGKWPAKLPATVVALAVLTVAVALPLYGARRFASAPAAAESPAKGQLQWEPFSQALLEKYRSEGHPVFVDFTAKWCLSCQVNERVVLDRPEVIKRLQSSGVALVRADWTRHDEAIGEALSQLGRSGVPAYAIYSGRPNAPPTVLPEVLTPAIIFDALSQLKGSTQTAALR